MKPTKDSVYLQIAVCQLVCSISADVNHKVSYHYRWFSGYVIAAMLVDGKQKIAH